jgi:hypothetical protein
MLYQSNSIRWIWEDGYTQEHNILACGARGIRHDEKRPINAEWVNGLPELPSNWTMKELRSVIINVLHAKADVNAVLKQLGLPVTTEAKQVIVGFEAEGRLGTS